MTITYKIDHIPKGTACKRRPALPMQATTLTIHNTGNASSTAANERAWLTNASNDRQASYNIVVDQIGSIECIPLNENTWHSGDGSKAGSGNRTSISIEICESGDYSKALDNAVELVADMLKQRGWGVDRLRRHYDWSGKICPRLMYDGGKWTGWVAFKNRVAEKLQESELEMKVEDANAIITFIKAEWAAAHAKGDTARKTEANRLANVLRKASGQKEQ
ncbi:N-acetylmuramoyl-L-alanine amidase [Paenibacillus algorifonticola]|uniref:N-acetylmuramoyl-L-alanine amidase n=1 Tax=Paenibacillus algorifonticola TaxID=684063 RepID=A0A1I1XWF1_9BACL|nr:N-acetylmuramoyl-L-alanine amidase [Paenibacillus algorifonticola]SFE11697.1 N-acetylmuramoyl-L-alanine amidase [Paenibacillus algorifonticola]